MTISNSIRTPRKRTEQDYRGTYMIHRLIAFAMLAGFFCIASATAQPIATKDWVFSDTGGGSAIAYTDNDSGSRMGIYCYAAKSCDAYFYTSTTCEDTSKYPALMNSDTGARSFTITCKNIASAGEKPNFVFVFDEFDEAVNVMLKGHTLGIAIPLANGQFRVIRFSLEGSNEAISQVSRAVKPGAPNPVSTKQNKDEIL